MTKPSTTPLAEPPRPHAALDIEPLWAEAIEHFDIADAELIFINKLDPHRRVYADERLVHKVLLKLDDCGRGPGSLRGEYEIVETCSDIPGVAAAMTFKCSDVAECASFEHVVGQILPHMGVSWVRRALILLRLVPVVARLSWRGVSHNDLHASNIIVGAHGRPYVIDFGAAGRESVVRAFRRNMAALVKLALPSFMSVGLRRLMRFIRFRPLAEPTSEVDLAAAWARILRPTDSIVCASTKGSPAWFDQAVGYAAAGHHHLVAPNPTSDRDVAGCQVTAHAARPSNSISRAWMHRKHNSPAAGARMAPALRRPLDDVLGPVANVRLLIVDADGDELRVLAGARALLQRARPMVVLRYWRPRVQRFGGDPQRLFELLTRECGMRLGTVAAWLAGREALDVAGFATLYRDNRDMALIAYPTTENPAADSAGT